MVIATTVLYHGKMEYSIDTSNIPSRKSNRRLSCSRGYHNRQPIGAASLLLPLILFLANPSIPRWSAAAAVNTARTSLPLPTKSAFLHPSFSTSFSGAHSVVLHGWLDNFLPPPLRNNDNDDDDDDAESSDSERRLRYPEQYPATYELLLTTNDDDSHQPDAHLIRPLLKATQLESRSLEVVYDAVIHGWDAAAFHSRVDGRGAAVVLARVASTEFGTDTTIEAEEEEELVGGYNPKGWASMGGARPSVAAFLFYHRRNTCSNEGDDDGGARTFQKLRKVGGGGMACANDNPDFGIAFGPDGFLLPLGRDDSRCATSKLGTYYERGPDERSSIFRTGGTSARLADLKVMVGVYEEGEEIPYAGAVLDMTSG